LALRFLKKYATKEDLAGIADVTEKTALLRVWKYVEAIQALKEKSNEIYNELYVATVDGIHFRIWEPRKLRSTKW